MNADRKEKQRAYRALPEVKARQLEQQRARRTRPEIKAKDREYGRLYQQSYRNRPEVKVKLQARRSNPETRARRQTKRRPQISRRLKVDIQFRLSSLLRRSMHSRIKRALRAGSAVRDLGCTIEEFKAYIEAQFLPGMTWDNWSLIGWHLDHKRPLSAFNLANKTEFLQACHYTNYQPLWAADNLRKSNRT